MSNCESCGLPNAPHIAIADVNLCARCSDDLGYTRRQQEPNTRYAGEWHIVDDSGKSLQSAKHFANANYDCEVLNAHNAKYGHSTRYHVERRK